MTIEQLLRKFEQACRLDEMAGSRHPLDRDPIREQFKNVKRLLRANLDLKKKAIGTLPKVEWPTEYDYREWNDSYSQGDR